MAKKRAQYVALDQGPPERKNHNIIRPELTVNNRLRLRVLDQVEYDRLLHLGLISLDEHVTAEHFARDLQQAGFIRSSPWTLDSSIRGDAQAISTQRSDALVRVGLARRWLHDKIGRHDTDWLVNICLDMLRVRKNQMARLKRALASYRAYEDEWYGYNGPMDLPTLLSNMGLPANR